jgi:hypothetical protein
MSPVLLDMFTHLIVIAVSAPGPFHERTAS